MGWAMALMMLAWLIIPLGIGAIWLRSARGMWKPSDSATDVLRERFARGEIDAGTYRTMLAQLSAGKD